MSDAQSSRVTADHRRSESLSSEDPPPRRALPEPDDEEASRAEAPADERPVEEIGAPPGEDETPLAEDESPLEGGAPPEENETPPEVTEPLPPTAADRGRPTRPPIVEAHAAIVEDTRPGRIQVASERFWTAAIVLGIVGILTALVTHGHAVDELTAKAHPGDPEEVRRAAANILHFTMIGIVGAGLIPEAILATFLGARRVIVRVVLSALALGAALILPLALEVLGPSGWRGTVIQICIIGHAALAIIASVLMWLPKGRRVKKK
ncbi:hypothetical protein AADG42_08065 [Ammonicoccus fulvus]|uniref:DUF2127 domain-containing protein n=1 Tax=Ammonicoccus fulvus TaxID=3138240 RepID=A0ABZ3FQ00_9ACTN